MHFFPFFNKYYCYYQRWMFLLCGKCNFFFGIANLKLCLQERDKRRLKEEEKKHQYGIPMKTKIKQKIITLNKISQ